MPSISIVSDSLLPLEALSLLGASTKRGEPDKIGRFGSGLKYALAYLLRSGVTTEIFIGEDAVQLSTTPVLLRGQTFHRVCINGAETGFTTELGPDWQLWQAIREIYCNALDEGGATLTADRQASAAGKTTIILTAEALAEVLASLETFFVTNPTRVVAATPFGRVLHRASPTTSFIYHKGIRVHTCETPLTFDYDLNEMILNEERAPRDHWRMWESLAQVIFSADSTFVAEKLSFPQARDLDSIPTYCSINLAEPSPAWQNLLTSRPLILTSHVPLLPASAISASRIVSSHLFEIALDKDWATSALAGNLSAYLALPPSPAQLADIAWLRQVCARVGIREFPIVVARFSDERLRGLAENGTAVLSEKSFIQGRQYLLETYIEEATHLGHGVADCTRAMQDALLQQFANFILSTND